MKLVKEHIYEKFTDESDPVHDIGIGVKFIWDNLKKGNVVKIKQSLTNLDNRLKIGTFLIILRVDNYPAREYTKQVEAYSIQNEKDIKEGLKNIDNLPITIDEWGWKFDFFKEFFEPIK